MVVSDEVSTRNRSIDLSFGIIVVILNIMEITMLSKLKSKLKIYERILLSLSIADLLFGLSNAIVCIVFLTNQRNEEIVEITYTTYFFFVLTSILHLALIAIDRLWAVMKPLQHKVDLTNKKISIAIALIWMFSLAISVSLIVYDEVAEGFVKKEKKFISSENVNRTKPLNSTSLTESPQFEDVFIDKYPEIMRTTLSSIIIIADFFFLLVNGIVVYKIQKSKQEHKYQIGSENSRKLRDKAAIVCILITLAFIIFTLPYPIWMFVNNNVHVVANLLLVSNSGMNSIIYFFRGRIEKFLNKRGFYNKDSSGTCETPLSERSSNVTDHCQ